MEVLIERESELAVLGEVLRAAAGGNGGAILIEGEAGIGKTRLLMSGRAMASGAGVRVLYATADETEARVPLAAARALLMAAARGVTVDGPGRLGGLALTGGLSDPDGPGSRADEVVHALLWLIVELADQGPIGMFLDDAHWADELTGRLLRLLGRRASELPVALVVAARPAAPGTGHSMLAADRAFGRLEPAPLSVSGTGRLLEQVLGRPGSVAAVARSRAVTSGNPLYLAELLLDARERGADPVRDGFIDGPAPPQLIRLLADRLDRLTPAAATLARAIAVLGSDATPARACALSRLDALDAIAAEETLRVERVLDSHAYRFIHPLIAAAVREGIRAVEAAPLHDRAAMLLARDGVDEQHVAEHLTHSPPRGDAVVVATLRRSAQVARRLGAALTATRLLERALAEPPAVSEVEGIEFEHGQALLDSHDENGARILLRLARHADNVSLRVHAARHLARHFGLTARGGDAVAVLGDVLNTLGDDHREMRLQLLAELGLTGGSDLRSRDSAKHTIADEASRCSGRTPGERLLIATAQLLRGGDIASAADAAVGARELLALQLHRDHGGGYAVGSLTFWATTTLLNADALDEAAQAMLSLRADAEQMALPDLIAGAIWQQAQIAYQRGDLARCELDARAAIEVGGGFARRLATPWLVMALSEQERLEEAEQLLASAGMLGAIPPSIALAAALSSRGRLRLAQGDAARAVDDLVAALDRNAAWGMRRLEPPWRPLLAEALTLIDRHEEAATEAQAYSRRATEWGTPRALGHAARMRALVSPRRDAIRLLEEARALFAASGGRLELARCLVELGTHRRIAGDRRAARAILRDAHDTAYACHASALCQQARAELLIAGGRPRPATGAGIDALTAAERRVAEIAAAGVTNREIARRLYLSPKTIEMHLRSTYRKLDLTGRDGLAAALE